MIDPHVVARRRFVAGPVTVEVPATSANLGPGYDCLGVALEHHDTLVGEVVPEGLSIEMTGEGADRLPRTERHLVVRAMRRMFDVLGLQPSGLRVDLTNRIPQSRGMGSSSAAIVGGLFLGRALVEGGAERVDDAMLLRLATALEGHPDNVAPALYGGFIVSGRADDEVWAVPAPLDDAVSVVVFIPPTASSTKAARSALPEQVSHADAAANTARATLLVTALGGRTDHLWRATEDFLHQPYRAGAMPDSYALVQRLRAAGVAAVISGAGPTVLAFVTSGHQALLAECPPGWQARALRIDRRGARIG